MSRPRRVMLIEDSRTQAERLRAQLASAGLDVAHVSSAEEAFEQMNSVRPDVILVDFHLPGKNGDEFCREIKSSVNTRAIPVLMLTADDSDAAQMRALESGADDYVAKSADVDILRARIAALLRKSPDASSVVFDEKRLGPPRILAIDDSPTYLYYIGNELRREKYQVDDYVRSARRPRKAAPQYLRLRADRFRNARPRRSRSVPRHSQSGRSMPILKSC